ncbi:MAG: ammonium transporter [Elainellaceae cyanobacterium]
MITAASPLEPNLDLIWVIFCAILVSTMQAGFCCLESGLVRAKNSINVAIKNLVDFCITSIVFSLVSFQLMFGETALGLVGVRLPPVSTWTQADYTFFLFQLVFCGTATTIVSGAVAERMSFLAYFITATTIALLIYPVVGHWIWGGRWFDLPQGWLGQLQFHDFAGATVVHSVGGWMALAAILVIGPRLGRFHPRPRPIEGHNLPTAVLGVFLLWFGWFGFNGGSTLAFNDQVPRILVVTAQGGATGGLAALLTTWVWHKRPQVPLIMNGVVGGLVSVTAGCDVMLVPGAVVSGAIGGLLCTLSARWLSYYEIDDAVGVVPAHLVCGIWGTISVALFADPALDSAYQDSYSLWQHLGVQSLGVCAVGLYTFSVSYALLWTVNRLLPLRVTPEQERIGLNIAEHNASTSTQDLIASMNAHSLKGDFTQPVVVEPGTEVASIADYYNRVLEKMSQIKAELNDSHGRLQTILNAPAFPVVISDVHDGTIQFINECAAEQFGFTLQEAGRYRETHFWTSLSDRATFFTQVKQHGRVSGFEASLCNGDGEFWCLISGLEIIYNHQPCVLFSFSDISAQIERESTLRYLASTDSLTGLYNRRTFFERAESLLTSAYSDSWPMAMLMLDIDHFKQINDQFGHARGDKVLQQVARICTLILDGDGVLGRLGGEEFALLLRHAPVSKAIAIAEALRQHVAGLNLIDQSGQQIPVTISVGVGAVSPGDTVDVALQHADLALYQAKGKGRNRVEQYKGDW